MCFLSILLTQEMSDCGDVNPNAVSAILYFDILIFIMQFVSEWHYTVGARIQFKFRQIFINSPKGLLGTPVQFLINAIIYSTNHMAVASMHLGVWSWSR